MNILDWLRKKVEEEAEKKVAILKAWETMPKTSRKPYEKVYGAIKEVATDLPANVAYLNAKASQLTAPKYTLPTAKEQQEMESQLKESNQPRYDFWPGPTKSMSAEINPFPIAPDTPEAKMAEKIKQRVLNSGAFKPAMKRFLATVPAYTFLPNQEMAGVANTRFSTPPNEAWETGVGPSQPTIGLAVAEKIPLEKLENNPYVARVMAHELVHTAPRNREFKNFKKFFNQVKRGTNPLLYETGLQYYQNGQPPPNAEEFYATIATEMGPNVLQIPEIKKFYENIFTNK